MSYNLIKQAVVGAGGVAQVSFTSIPQDGTDLIVSIAARASNAVATPVLLTFDNGVNSPATYRTLKVIGTTISSTSNSAGSSFAVAAANTPGNALSNTTVYIYNYSIFTGSVRNYFGSMDSGISTTVNESRNLVGMEAVSWNTSSGFFTIRVSNPTGNLIEGSVISIYSLTRNYDGITTVS